MILSLPATFDMDMFSLRHVSRAISKGSAHLHVTPPQGKISISHQTLFRMFASIRCRIIPLAVLICNHPTGILHKQISRVLAAVLIQAGCICQALSLKSILLYATWSMWGHILISSNVTFKSPARLEDISTVYTGFVFVACSLLYMFF